MRTWVFVTAIILGASYVRSEYGDKVRSDVNSSSSSENLSSSEEYYDDSLEEGQTYIPEKPTATTTDAGVVLDEAILSAVATPKATYNLIDYPIKYDESLGDSYTQAKFNDNKFGYSGSDISNTQEDVKPNKNINIETMQKSSQTHNRYNFPSWNFLDMFNIPNPTTHKPFSASYRSPFVPNIESTKADEIKTNGLPDDGDYDPIANGDFLQLEDNSFPPSSWPYSNDISSPEVLSRLEQERQYQIESTKSFLEQVKATQEYASRIQALHNSLYPGFHSSRIQYSRLPESESQTYGSSTTPIPQSSMPIGHNKYAHGINSHLIKESYNKQMFTPDYHTTAAQVNSLAEGYRMSTFATAEPYTGPTASPLVLPSGYLADTEEVTLARIAHLQALMNAIESSSVWRHHK